MKIFKFVKEPTQFIVMDATFPYQLILEILDQEEVGLEANEIYLNINIYFLSLCANDANGMKSILSQFCFHTLSENILFALIPN